MPARRRFEKKTRRLCVALQVLDEHIGVEDLHRVRRCKGASRRHLSTSCNSASSRSAQIPDVASMASSIATLAGVMARASSRIRRMRLDFDTPSSNARRWSRRCCSSVRKMLVRCIHRKYTPQRVWIEEVPEALGDAISCRRLGNGDGAGEPGRCWRPRQSPSCGQTGGQECCAHLATRIGLRVGLRYSNHVMS